VPDTHTAAIELFRTTVEAKIRRRCRGACRYCQAPYGGPDLPYRDWNDLFSWIFGHCSFRCRLAAGEAPAFDIPHALSIVDAEELEARVRRRCQGTCGHCGTPYGGSNVPYGDWKDLFSWMFGHCSLRCRLAAGEAREFDVQKAVSILYPEAS